MITVCLCLQLVDGHSLFDYNVGLNEIIQLIVQQPRQLTESNKCSLGGDTITEVNEADFGFFSPFETKTDTWDEDDTVELTAWAAYNNDDDISQFADTALWTASIRNDDSRTFPLEIVSIAPTTGTGKFNITMQMGSDKPAATSRLYDATATLTMRLAYRGTSASQRIKGIAVVD